MTDLDSMRADALVTFIEEQTRALRATLDRARAVQWDAPPRETARAERASASGEPSNPTADTALDGQRLRLRDSIVTAEAALRRIGSQIAAARRYLEMDLRPYEE